VHPKGPTATVGRHEILLGRLAHLVSKVLAQSTDCTQPSWLSALMAERWFHAALAILGPDVLLCRPPPHPQGAVRATGTGHPPGP